MKDLHIKFWPETTGYLPGLFPFPKFEGRENSIFLDFSNCSQVSSSGLNIHLIRLLKIVKFDDRNRGWHTNPISNPILHKVNKLNYFEILNMYKPNISLFQDRNILNKSKITSTNNYNNQSYISFPIYNIDFKRYENRRKALISFKEWLNENLKPYYKNYDFNLPQVILVINEIAKNSADHTDDNAFLGLDIFFNDKEKFIKICFSIGDIGKGINQNIKDNLPENMKERLKYWDLTQMYRVALKRGFTTKQNFHENKGMGMSIILDGAKGIELDLSVFDAKSRGVLSNIHSLSHSEIRKNFFYIGNFVGFYYYGELKAKKIKNEKNFSFR